VRAISHEQSAISLELSELSAQEGEVFVVVDGLPTSNGSEMADG
jgi:hypothetical protein